MLARQEEDFSEHQPLSPEEEQQLLRQTPKEPLMRTVLDTSTRSHAQLLFLTMAVLALLVTVGSGASASRGYALIEVQHQADQLEQENERLKIDIAKLKSPDRIKAIATDQLGMEVPKRTYFSHDNQ